MISFLYFLIALAILILVHEFGHFMVARIFNIKVLVFSIGFGKKLVRYIKGETEYAISIIPMGGYVKLLGESPDEEVAEEDRPRSFSHKPPYVRILVALAGPVFNVLLALIVFYFVSIIGYNVPSARVGNVADNMPAQAAGIQKGDIITGIDGQTITEFLDIASSIEKTHADTVKVKVDRNGTPVEFMVKPTTIQEKDIFGESFTRKILGIERSDEVITKRQSPLKAVPLSFYMTWEYSRITVVGVIKIIQGSISPKNIGGPVLIFQEASKRAKKGFGDFVLFFALISINLGVINLLPIPVLDGGHILFNAIEIVIRRRIPHRAQEIAQTVGLVILLLIMVFAFYNDFDRIFDFGKYIHGR
ncbi:MAG: RIP metalloprotease RseP [Syntrophorhabdaceae bacterium]|nr:RIP metalloprotease RseP [Syntrophorhabdaceae bacterium]MDD4197518.1 RIP metalloprotease RseP [Syntrophorhabdaceae bacterium]